MSDLQSDFANPGPSYRPQPLWLLNHHLEESRLRQQVRDMASQGAGGAVLQAGAGLQVEFMSAEWLQALRCCLLELQAHGMQAWLSDDSLSPADSVASRLAAAHPELRQLCLRVQTFAVRGGATFQATLEPDDNELSGVYGYRLADPSTGELDPEGRELTERYQAGKLRWEAPPGEWLLAVYWVCPLYTLSGSSRVCYLDRLNSEAAVAFRQQACEPYTELVADFPGTLKGMMTIASGLSGLATGRPPAAWRPDLNDPQRTLPGFTLPWTRDFEHRFWKLTGYDIKPRLLSLLHDSGPESSRWRADFYRAIATWQTDFNYQAVAAWCHVQGLEYVAVPPVAGRGEPPGSGERQLREKGSAGSRAGVICSRTGLSDSSGNTLLRAVKKAASAGPVPGQARVVALTSEGVEDEQTPAGQRQLAQSLAVAGAGLMIPGAWPYSLAGYRKTLPPAPGLAPQPYWPMYRPLADYMARLCLLQAEGEPVHQVAVVVADHPAAETPGPSSDPVAPTATEQARLQAKLEASLWEQQIGFDYWSPATLAEATFDEGVLTLADSQARWSVVILCGLKVLPLDVMRRLAEYFRQGGKVITVGELPGETGGSGAEERLRELVGEVFGEPDSTGQYRHEHESGGVALAWGGEHWAEGLATDLPRLVEPTVRLIDEQGQPLRQILCSHRRTEIGESYLLINRSQTPCEGTFSCHSTGAWEEWSLESGERAPLAVEGEIQGPATIPLEFEPGEARLLVCDPGGEATAVAQLPEPVVLERLELSDQWQFDCSERNVMVLDRWQLTTAMTPSAAGEGGAAADSLPTGTDEAGPGVVNSYQITVAVEGNLRPVHLVLDDLSPQIIAPHGDRPGGRSVEVLINGHQLPPLTPTQWQGSDCWWVNLTGRLTPGDNQLVIKTRGHGEPPPHLHLPACLVGAFRLVNGTLQPEKRTLTGFFTDCGYPHLAEAGYYRQIFTVPERFAGGQRFILDPGEVAGSLRVWVNGRETGCRLWPPYEVDITPAVKPGENNELVLEVAGTLGNLYGPTVSPCGVKGCPTLWVLS